MAPRDDRKGDSEKAAAKSPTDADVNGFLLRNLHVDVRRGTVTLLGDRYTLLSPHLLVAIQKQLEATIGTSAKGVLYLAGERMAAESLPLMMEKVSGLPPGSKAIEALEQLGDYWAILGLGRISVSEYDPRTPRFTFTIESGALPEAYGASTKPVCHLWAGLAAGLANRLFHVQVLCEEVRCRAAGAERCEFVADPLPGR